MFLDVGDDFHQKIYYSNKKKYYKQNRAMMKHEGEARCNVEENTGEENMVHGVRRVKISRLVYCMLSI